MIEIQYKNSPFVYNSILDLIGKLKYVPHNFHEGIILNMLNPFNENYKIYKQESHLTDKQTETEQIRYLGTSENERKLILLAYLLKDKIPGNLIIIKIINNDVLNERVQMFFNYLRIHNKEIQLKYHYSESKVKSVTYINKIERLYFKSGKNTDDVNTLLNAAITCMNAGNYWTAINLLETINNVSTNNIILNCEIKAKLASAYEIVGDTITSEKYWLYVLKSGNLNQRYRASYSLGMINIRHHSIDFINIEAGEEYLRNILIELEQNYVLNPTDDLKVDIVFNKNGLALAEFKKGNTDEALNIVQEGIKELDKIDSHYSKFHQSVLYFNVYQCQLKNKNLNSAEETLLTLIKIDPIFFSYHEYLIIFYTDILKDNTKALKAVNNILKIFTRHYKFYFLKAKILFDLNSIEKATQLFIKSNKLNPLYLPTISYLSTIYCSLENYEAAIAVINNINIDEYEYDKAIETILLNKVICLMNLETSMINLKKHFECIKNYTHLNNQLDLIVKSVYKEPMKKSLFDTWAKKYEVDILTKSDKYPFAGYLDIIEKLKEKIINKKCKSILDIGIGTGYMLSKIINNQIVSENIYGIDFSTEMLKVAASKFGKMNLIKHDIVKPSIPKKIKENKFDCILSAFTLHHFDDLSKIEIINNYFNLINSNGIFIIADICFKNQEDFNRVKINENGNWDIDEENGYIILDSFQKLLKLNNYKITTKIVSYCSAIIYLTKQ